MRWSAIVLACLLVTACRTSTRTESTVISWTHEQYAALRPAMVALRVDGAGANSAVLQSELYRELIRKNYSVLAPGAATGEETGVFRAKLMSPTAPWSAEAVLEDPFGTVIYRATAKDWPGTVNDLALKMAEALPGK